MPPKTKKKTKKGKTKASKCKCSSHIQSTKVSVGGGGGGGGGAPIVYATYAPPPPSMPTSMPFETGQGFAPNKFERTPYNNHGVNASQGNYSANASQAHSNMSLLEKYFHDADAAKPQSEAGRSSHPMSEGGGASGSRHSQSSVNMSPKTMSTSSFTNHVSSIPATEIIGTSRGKPPSSRPSLQGGNSKLQTPMQKAAGKRPMRPISESGSYMSGHVSNSSGSINPNAIVPRASGQRSYGSVYEVPGEMAGKFARVSRDVFIEAQRQKDLREFFKKQNKTPGFTNPGLRLAKRRLYIAGATNPDQIPDRVV